jgi:VWFA-related protein
MRLSPLLLATCALAQDPQSPPAPTIKVTTRLVQVSVIVHDKKGQPVPDLTKSDFAVLDRGKEQSISVFKVQSTNQVVPRLTLPPNIYTNRVASRGETPTSATVILFDGLNTKWQDQVQAKRHLIKFLQEMEFQDRIALYILGRGVSVLHDFTNDPDHLLNVLAKFRGRLSAELDGAEPAEEPSTGNDEMDQQIAHAIGMMSDFYNVNRALLTLQAMEAIANHLAGIPGRKNLVWVSGGFPFTLGLDPDSWSDSSREHRTFAEETERVARAMNNANIAIYPVDARGLIAIPQMSAENKKSPFRPGKTVDLMPKNLDTMETLADSTGGRAFYNTNDIKGAIRKAVDDASVTYTLGFYPSAEDWDGKYHKLQVKLTHRKGLDVRARKGFVAFNEQTPTLAQEQAVVTNTLESPLDATGIGLFVRTDPSDKPEKGKTRLTIQIDPVNVSLESKDGHYVGVLDFTFCQQSNGGKPLVSTNESIKLNLLPATYEQVMKHALLLTMYVVPQKDVSTLRVVVLDRPTGTLGSVHVPLKAD